MNLPTLIRTGCAPSIFLVASGCLLGSGDGDDWTLDPRLDGILEAHNEVRANVSPAASPALAPMTWSDALARDASEHAALCIWEHSSKLGALEQGENLAAYTPANLQTGEDPAFDWADEVAFYDYDTNGCSGVCGHYTQMVWRESVELGCAVQECPDGLEGFEAGREIWVCRYSPPGNYIGEKPY